MNTIISESLDTGEKTLLKIQSNNCWVISNALSTNKTEIQRLKTKLCDCIMTSKGYWYYSSIVRLIRLNNCETFPGPKLFTVQYRNVNYVKF